MMHSEDAREIYFFIILSLCKEQKQDAQDRTSGPPRLKSSESICQNKQWLSNASQGLSLEGGLYSLLSSAAASYVLPALRLLSDELP